MGIAADVAPSNGKKKIQPINLVVGACLNIFEVSTLGQPFEVLKTHMAANRGDPLKVAYKKTLARGGITGFCKRDFRSQTKQTPKRDCI